jgi:hypothetical protein
MSTTVTEVFTKNEILKLWMDTDTIIGDGEPSSIVFHAILGQVLVVATTRAAKEVSMGSEELTGVVLGATGLMTSTLLALTKSKYKTIYELMEHNPYDLVKIETIYTTRDVPAQRGW